MKVRFLAMAILAVVAIATGATAADLHVPATYSTIAAALANASSGDRVIVAPGTYREHDLDLVAGVTLVGNPAGPETVVIDAVGQGRVLRAENLDRRAVVNGVTLTGGRARGETHYARSGGGILISHSEVRLENVRVIGNVADGSGGGVRATASAVLLLNCVIGDNIAAEGGGGLDSSYGSSPTLTQCEIASNEAAWGGGAAVRGPSVARFFSCQFTDNQAQREPGLGGAVATDLGAMPSFTECVLMGNAANHGGGVFSGSDARPSFSNVTLHQNGASVAGGGLYCHGDGASLDHTIIAFHEGSAVSCPDGAPLAVAACDIYGNSGGDWNGALGGRLGLSGNISADPLFCEATNLRLQDTSPCSPERSGVGLIGALEVGCISAVDLPDPVLPASIGASPNPFNPRTVLSYNVPQAGHVRLSVYDVQGRLLDVLVDESRAQGEHQLTWHARDQRGRNLASGTYLLVLETARERVSQKVSLIR